MVGQVKNTFISVHIPSTPSGAAVQQPMASAPAMVQRASLQDSLAAAAERADSGEDDVAFGEVVPSPSNRVMQGRARPAALAESPPTMAAIPESPSAALGLSARVYANVSSSVPPTPQMCYSAVTTPTGTPQAMQRSTLPLSLGKMIQSPTADAKAQMMQSAYQQVYMQAPTVTQAPAQYFVPTQQFQVQQPPLPIGQYVVQQPMPAAQAFTQPAAAPADQSPVQQGSPQQSAAAVQLGLVPQQQQPAMPAPSQMAVGVMPAPPQHAAVVQQVPQRTVITMPPAPMGGLPPPPMAAPQIAAPTLAAAPAMAAAPLTMAQRAAPPPPPMAPAPQIAMLSPKGMPAPAGIAMQTPQGLSPTMMPAVAATTPDSDMKVLVDMAVASGNQAAVDALMRQAQSQGIAPEHFIAMVEAARS